MFDGKKWDFTSDIEALLALSREVQRDAARHVRANHPPRRLEREIDAIDSAMQTRYDRGER